MKIIFHQYFRPTEAEMTEMIQDAFVCYDANVLLNGYRYSDETQKGLVEVFKDLMGRTYLPHQVAFEYSRNRAKTIVDQVNLCAATEDAFKKVIKDFITPKDKQPFLSARSTKALNGVMSELANKRKALESMISEDTYADLLHSLFNQRIGPAPDEESLTKLHEQAKDRYEKQIPPGYSDLKDKTPPLAYGDYIVWRQLMDLAKKERRDVIFVTDDTKDDWRLTFSGKTIGPRPELLDEFRRETGQRIWILTSEGFLKATKKAGSTAVANSVIEEVSARFVAQASAFASEDKLSSPNIEPDDEMKQFTSDVFNNDASLRESKLTIPNQKSGARSDKKAMVTSEDDGEEE